MKQNMTGSPLNGATDPWSSASNRKQSTNCRGRTRPGDTMPLLFFYCLLKSCTFFVKQVFVVSNQPMGRAQAPGVPMPTQGMVSPH